MITVSWPPAEETYIVEQDGVFIKDTEVLHEALEFALAVGDANSQIVEVVSIGPPSRKQPLWK